MEWNYLKWSVDSTLTDLSPATRVPALLSSVVLTLKRNSWLSARATLSLSQVTLGPGLPRPWQERLTPVSPCLLVISSARGLSTLGAWNTRRKPTPSLPFPRVLYAWKQMIVIVSDRRTMLRALLT